MQERYTATRQKKRGFWQENKRNAEVLCMQLLFAALGALTGAAELIFSVRPFGIALAAGAVGFFPVIALGAGAFYVFTRDHVSLIALALLALARLIMAFYPHNGRRKRGIFHERVRYRVTFAAVALFGTGLYRVIWGGFRFFDLFGLMLAVLAAALATFLYAGMFAGKDRLFPYSREAGFAALVLTCVFAMRAVSFFGIYPSAVAAALAAFWLVAHRGVSMGAVGGLMMGLCFDYRLAPAFLLCGLCFGLLEKSSRGGGILCGGGAASLYAYAVLGAGGITAVLPALLAAGALFLAGDSAGLVEGSPAYRMAVLRRRAAAQSVKAGEQAENEARFKGISGALLELSNTFYELSAKTRRPGLQDLRRLCDRSFDGFCPACRHRDVCWGSEYRGTATALEALGDQLYLSGNVKKEQVPEHLQARCPHLSDILRQINDGAVRLSEEALRGDKTSVVATDYAAVGRILGEALEDGREACEADPALGERLQEHLQRRGYTLESVAVCGKKHRRVLLRGIRLPGRHLKIRELRAVLEQVCRFPLGKPQTREAEGVQDLIFSERERYESAVAKESRAKSKGSGRYCGDTATHLSLENGKDYVFLCDGMGTGSTAALTSALATTFLCRMLQAGSRPESALRMLNGFLASRGSGSGESSTTVDMLEVDRVSGEACLFKCGAAPTYLLRDGEVTVFASRTAPAGILESLDAERIAFALKKGDVLMQVSDGITGEEENCTWPADMLRERYDGEREHFVRAVLNRAAEKGDDDMTVILTEIRSATHGEDGISPETGRVSA